MAVCQNLLNQCRANLFISGVRGQYKLIVEHYSGVLLFKQFGRINRSSGRKQKKQAPREGVSQGNP